MKSDAYKTKPIPKPTGLVYMAVMLLFLLMELPVRLWLQPDPWLLDAQNWYFNQPLRLAIELTLVMVVTGVVKYAYPNLFRLHRGQTALLVGSILVSAIVFGLLEAEQLLNSVAAGLWLWLAWFTTGFCIGMGQELLYRGLLFSSLTRFMSVTLAGAITTVAFVLAPLHSVRLWHYLQQEHFMVVAMLVGIYIGASIFFQWLRNYTDTVLAPGLVHGVGNAITWVAVFA